MSERNKRIAAICLIIGGLVLVGYNFLRSSEPTVHGQKVDQPVHLDSLFAIEASEPAGEQQADVLALFVLKSDVCPPCVNNTLEYIELLNKNGNRDIISTALFIEKEPKKVHRFVQITKFPVPYRIATADKLPDPLKNMMQKLVFIDLSKHEIFYQIMIPPNRTTQIEYKKQVLTQALGNYEN